MSNSVKVKLVHFRNPNEIYIKFLEGDKSRNNVVNARKINKVQDKLAYLCENATRTNNPELGEVIIIIIEYSLKFLIYVSNYKPDLWMLYWHLEEMDSWKSHIYAKL